MKLPPQQYKVALLGKDIQYSLSPKLFSHPKIYNVFPNSFELINLNSKQEWDNFWVKKKFKDYDFLCVTTPWKKEILNIKETYPTKKDCSVHQTANWFYEQQDLFYLLNTDYYVFDQWWNELPNQPREVFYLSTGASCLTFLSMLKTRIQLQETPPHITIVTRNPSEKLNFLKNLSELNVNLISYEQLETFNITLHTLLINGTPLGQRTPLPQNLIKIFERGMVWDLNYAITKPISSFYCKGGHEFLVRQALHFLYHLRFIEKDFIHQHLQELTEFLKEDAL